MIYKVRTLEIGSKLYRANGYPPIDMMEVLKYQQENPPKPEEKHWAYSLYFSEDPHVCAGYIVDCKPGKYLIEITLKRHIEYIFTDDPVFFAGGVSPSHMEEIVIPETSEAIRRHTQNLSRSQFHHPDMSFMQELGEKRFAFCDIMVMEKKKDGKDLIQQEIIIPHSLLIGGVFTQRALKYKMNEFELVEI